MRGAHFPGPWIERWRTVFPAFPSRRRGTSGLCAWLPALVAGGALRFWWIHAWPQVQGDTFVYGDIARNWLTHGIYGRSFVSASGLTAIHPTLLRLPGYPAFLALCFSLFGLEHYGSVLDVQAVLDLASCLLIAGFVAKACGRRAAMTALWLAALCPFLANYAATPLTETPSIFCVALGFYALAALLRRPRWIWVVLLAFAWSMATLLRPDGALLAAVLFASLIFYGRREFGWARALRLALLCGLLSILPFVPWTLRNWRTFHVFQPLAPRYATDPGEFTTPGFIRWTRTWTVDFASTAEIYWNAGIGELDLNLLPDRAFDTPQQYEQTRKLFAEYNSGETVTVKMDAAFGALARERIRSHPVRYFLELPLLRVADMWLRPRLEMLNVNLRWWQYSKHPLETCFALAYGALNLAYLAAALAGAFRGPRWAGAMAAFLLLRTLMLATLEAPESRYTIECFPVIIALAAAAISTCSESSFQAPF